jgi:hypothetical protein
MGMVFAGQFPCKHLRHELQAFLLNPLAATYDRDPIRQKIADAHHHSPHELGRYNQKYHICAFERLLFIQSGYEAIG